MQKNTFRSPQGSTNLSQSQCNKSGHPRRDVKKMICKNIINRIDTVGEAISVDTFQTQGEFKVLAEGKANNQKKKNQLKYSSVYFETVTHASINRKHNTNCKICSLSSVWCTAAHGFVLICLLVSFSGTWSASSTSTTAGGTLRSAATSTVSWCPTATWPGTSTPTM